MTKRWSAVVLTVLMVLAASGPAGSAPPEGKGKPPKGGGGGSLEFAGMTWDVKTSKRPVGPGPNIFGGDNVWVDGDGDLHLRIARRKGKWTTAEVVGSASLGHGTYRWTIASGLDSLDPNVVLGLFTWDDDPAEAHREIDLEWARWGDASSSTNAQYVVQPYEVNAPARFTQPPGGGSIHEFTWLPDRVEFRSWTSTGAPIASWDFTGDVPTPGAERPRMNLWLFQGRAPLDGSAVEVVIDDFSFTPA